MDEKSRKNISEMLQSAQLPVTVTFELPENENIVSLLETKFHFIDMETNDERAIEGFGEEHRRELLSYLDHIRPLENSFYIPLMSKIVL